MAELFAFTNMNLLNLEQRRTGVVFDCYRKGLEFNNADPDIQALIAGRTLPHNYIISAYSALHNPLLRLERDHLLNAKVFDRVSAPGINIRRVAARKNPNDIAQALTDFQTFKTRWGTQIKCQ